ncbi:MAG: cbb3-type cytochrome oxidase assembly protein CcoS [Bosea sp. (in: a-proteobacteria)]|uniref:cbb3-type cytochrome oxidase assembly protein CcoS n=1 Tax=Bosea sp. (in: a-proteobacteria) TaxID=1871050 RepID=UPI0027331839|nr:cbb3-type cytochrome oxidase assembly protein CcoS [Bosea sp. (in: a-proteobacteria)]MDP3603479.1 cbb3-type cytochrome oxidase assembly protein CcoS [Bosea sp. (in: a-proteobacteria)]
MNILVVLFPLALGMGLAGLAAFFWCMRTGQYADIEGSAWRVLQDDDLYQQQDPVENLLDDDAPAQRRSGSSRPD